MCSLAKRATTQNAFMTTVSRAQALPSIAAVLAQTTGEAAKWATFFPSYEVAAQGFSGLPIELKKYLMERAGNHGIDAIEMLRKIPEKLWKYPEVLEEWLKMMDISHIRSQATRPDLADDPKNVIWEPIGDNRSRGMAEMTGDEFKEALDNGVETGRQLIGEINQNSVMWIDLRELFHAFQKCAEALGYSLTWVPREMWGTFMENILNMLRNLRAAAGWTQKVRVAKEWVTKDVAMWVKQHKHPMAAAFMLAVLTLEMPALAFLLTTWGCTGLLGLAVHALKYLVANAEKNAQYKGKRFDWIATLLKHFNMGLGRLEVWINRIHNILNSIKNGIFTVATKVVDFIVGVAQHAWKTIVKPVAQKVISKAKNVFIGFLSWIDSGLQSLGHLAIA